MKEQRFVPAVSAGEALDSFRNSDFDFYSALFEVVDNSIQADADNIWIYLHTTDKSLIKVIVIDDGVGMPQDVINHCMSLGYSSRYNDRNGIGRFGVGMTLAAISQCRNITCVSKPELESKWLGTELDINKIKNQYYTGIPEPSEHFVDNQIKDFIESKNIEHGTLVIWSELDRVTSVPKKFEKLLEQCNYRLGRVFRKWLMPETVDNSHKKQINIFLNDKKILFFDPLFSIISQRFPDDPVCNKEIITVFEPIEYPIPNEVIKEDLSAGRSKSSIKIIMSLVPEEFRRTRYKGGAGEEFEGKYLDENKNEGVSILRAGREVHYDHLKYYSPKFEQIDRWWRCEIQFDPVLDFCFSVKNIKMGVRMLKDLQDLVKEKIEPTRRQYIKEIKNRWDQTDNEQAGNNGHGIAESSAKKALQKDHSLSPKTTNKNRDQIIAEQDKVIEMVAKDASNREKALLAERYKNNPYSIEEGEWPGSVFFDEKPVGDNTVLVINKQHIFYSTVYKPLRDLISSNDSSDMIRIKSSIDLLLVAFVNVCKHVSPNESTTWEEFHSRIMDEWGRHLTSFVNEMKK